MRILLAFICRAKADLGIGEASVLLPGNAGIQMSIGSGFSFLSRKNMDGSLYKRGRSYYSEDFEDSGSKSYLRFTPELGGLNVDQK